MIKEGLEKNSYSPLSNFFKALVMLHITQVFYIRISF